MFLSFLKKRKKTGRKMSELIFLPDYRFLYDKIFIAFPDPCGEFLFFVCDAAAFLLHAAAGF